MNINLTKRTGLWVIVLLLVASPVERLEAHGGGNWDPFTIDTVNNGARDRLLALQALMSEVIRGRIGGDKWPLDDFQKTRDALLTIKEEVDEIVAHFVFDGVNIQAASQLRDEPRAGRAEAASRAIDAGIALLEDATAQENAKAFISDFYARGMTARLYELLGAHLDRMELYAALTSQSEEGRGEH